MSSWTTLRGRAGPEPPSWSGAGHPVYSSLSALRHWRVSSARAALDPSRCRVPRASPRTAL
eukprot:1027899-Lingulodinium_polyedra.AAC.1